MQVQRARPSTPRSPSCWEPRSWARSPSSAWCGRGRGTSARLLEYCGILTIWTIGSLLISGIDTAIVGHFDYKNTGYYAIASSATNFMLLLVSNLMGPLLPAISSLQVERTPRELGGVLV